MKVWVLVARNNGWCRKPDVFDSMAKAVAKMTEDYMEEVATAEDDEEAEKCNPIEDKGINTDAGWAYIQYRDNYVDFNIYEEEVK